MSQVERVPLVQEKMILSWVDHALLFLAIGLVLSSAALAFLAFSFFREPYYRTETVLKLGPEYTISMTIPDRIVVGKTYWARLHVRAQPNAQPRSPITATLVLASPFLVSSSGGADSVQVSTLDSSPSEMLNEQILFQVLGTSSNEAQFVVRASYLGQSSQTTLATNVDHLSESLFMVLSAVTGIPGFASLLPACVVLIWRRLTR